MKSNEELLNEIYSHFTESEDKNETMSLLICDCIETGICYWNTRWPDINDDSDLYYSEMVWEEVKAGKTLTFGDMDNTGDFNLKSISRALETLKKTDKEMYEDIITENWDSESCDVFFQIAIFGEVVFG